VLPQTQSTARHNRRKVLGALAASGVAMATLQSCQPAAAQNAVRLPVLCYHNIDYSGSAYAITPELLDQECQWLIANGYTAITVYQLWNTIATGAALPLNPVMLTNDDGWSSAVTFAQTLMANGLVGNYFINNYSPLSATEIQFLTQNGPVEAHTVSHQYMSQLDPATQNAEIADNLSFILGITGQPAQFLAWPFGDYNASAVQIAKDNGILAAFALGGAPCYVGVSDILAMPRIMMEVSDTLETFVAKVNHW
jgi:hypothetical protein